MSKKISRKQMKALKRRLDRAEMEVRRFKTHSTYRPSWTLQESPDTAIGNALLDLRARSRHLAENHDLYAGLLDDLVNQIVGTGLTVEPMGTSTTGRPIQRFNETMRREFAHWQEHPEATGELSWDETQRKVCWMWLADGEVFCRDVTSGAYPWMPGQLRYTFEVLESDYVPSYFVADTRPSATDNTLGVRLDRWNRPASYYFYRSHPGDRLGMQVASVQDLLEVPADQVCHLKFTRRWPQTRGQPIAHATFDRLADIYQYEEYERIAAKMAGALGIAIKRDVEMAGDQIGAYGDEDQAVWEMSAGQIYQLRPGESVESVGANRPNPELTNFRRSQLRAAAAGAGTKASTLMREYDSSYSAARQEMVEAEVGYMKLRRYFVEHFVRRVYQRVVEAAMLAGRVELPRTATMDTATRIEVNGPGMAWIDPLKEVQADIAAIGARLTSRTAVIRKRGGDPDKVARQIEMELENDPQDPRNQPADPISDSDGAESESGEEDGAGGAEQRNAGLAVVRG